MEIKIKTLDKIHEAQDFIINALADSSLSNTEIKNLQDTSSKLRNIERSIVSLIGQALIESLNSDSTDLKNLVEEIKKSADKLSRVSDSVEKAASVVAAFINILSTALAAGIL